MVSEIEEKIYEELTRIRNLLEILASDKIREKLDSLATTRERQAIWARCDGLTSTEEIANRTQVSQRTVQLFVKELLEKDLLYMGKRGYPKRRFEIIPAHWRVEQDVRTVE
jgi:DNA-binding NarL/FixJ family response regulator